MGLFLICFGGDKLVDSSVALAKKIGIPQIVVGATIVSIGTTLPEILVSTTAAFDGSAAISAGNAFGSIICNTALIAGFGQLIRPAKKGGIHFSGLEMSVLFATILALTAYGWFTGSFDRVSGIVLLCLFVLYAWLNMARAKSEEEVTVESEESLEELKKISLPRNLMMLAFCAVLLFLGANLLVDNGIIIAGYLGVPERVIAVTAIALGTSPSGAGNHHYVIGQGL